MPKSKSAKSSEPKASSAKTAAVKPVPIDPVWPSVSVKQDLECRVLEQDQIIVIDNFLTKKECADYIKFLESFPLTITPPPKRGEAERVNHRISIPSPAFATSLYTALSPHLPSLPSFQRHLRPLPHAAACNPNIRLYKYTPGQYFGPHYDDSISDNKNGTWSEWTILVYLSGVEDGVKGGETVFYRRGKVTNVADDIIIGPLARGTALLHRHGKECMLHEGRLVQDGATKYVLRSDLMFAR